MKDQLSALLFPAGLLDYFEVVSINDSNEQYIFDLDEKNIVPPQKNKKDLESKGFYSQESVSDFPLRGKRCTLRIRRRRWLDKSTGEIVQRDWKLIAQGTRITSEFASFLKEFN